MRRSASSCGLPPGCQDQRKLRHQPGFSFERESLKDRRMRTVVFIDGTQWVVIDKAMYDSCLDPVDYR